MRPSISSTYEANSQARQCRPRLSAHYLPVMLHGVPCPYVAPLATGFPPGLTGRHRGSCAGRSSESDPEVRQFVAVRSHAHPLSRHEKLTFRPLSAGSLPAFTTCRRLHSYVLIQLPLGNRLAAECLVTVRNIECRVLDRASVLVMVSPHYDIPFRIPAYRDLPEKWA